MVVRVAVARGGAASAAKAIAALAGAGATGLLLEIGSDLDAAEARELVRAASAWRLRVEVPRRSGGGAVRQYREVAAELPSSVLWCRIAMRATRAGRRSAGPTSDAI